LQSPHITPPHLHSFPTRRSSDLVNQRPINVPRPALQIASHPPATWGIVPRPVNARSLPSTWGARYAVCPKCHARASLPKGPVAIDRKSTRLNSSHRTISYAVFCL